MVTSKSALKSRLLEFLRKMEETGEEIIITDFNRPVGKIMPFKPRKTMSETFRNFHGKAIYKEDIMRPTTSEWMDV